MLDPRASLALTLALVPVVAWCLVCMVRRSHHADRDAVPLDVEVCHGGMGIAMLVMLWMPLSAALAWVGGGVFMAMLGWCGLRLGRDALTAWHRRVGVMSFAMVAMLLPAGTASAASHGSSGMSMPMSGTSTDVAHGSGSAMLLSGAGALAVALAVAVVGIAALRAAVRPVSTRARLSACCEVVAAAGMTVMALALL